VAFTLTTSERFPVNRFWNLVPTTSTLNLQKSNRIPGITDVIAYRYREFLRLVTARPSPLIAADLDWTWRKYFQSAPPTSPTPAQTTQSLWSIMESSLERLERAGVDVWCP